MHQHGGPEFGLISSIEADRSFRGTCTSCQSEFTLADAGLFSIDHLTTAGQAALNNRHGELTDRRKRIAQLRARIKQAAMGAKFAGVGKAIEKVAPILPGFAHEPRDCRFIGEPIDYLVFRGLAQHVPVDHLTFLDIKTYDGRLDRLQKQVRDAVRSGKVVFDTFKA